MAISALTGIPARPRTALVAALTLGLALTGCARPPDRAVGDLVTARTLGLIHLQENRLDQAEAAFLEVERLAPTEVIGPANLALVYLRLGRYADADAAVRRALAIDSSDVSLRLLEARVLQLTDRAAQARAALERLSRGEPPEPRVFYALAELAAEARDSAAWLAALERVAAAAPGNVAGRVELAQALVAAGHGDRALAELEAARQLPPAPPEEAAPFLAAAIRALQQDRLADASEQLDRFHRFLDGTVPFQSALAELRTPQGQVSGIPVLTFTPAFLIREDAGGDADQVSFLDATAPSGLPTGSRGDGPEGPALAVGDLDGDGWEEILVGRSDGPSELWRWDSTAWGNAAERAGLGPEPASAAAFGDYDNDGHPDLFVGDAAGNAHLYKNDGRGRLTDRAAPAGLGSVGVARRVLFADLDQDGDLDLFLATLAGNRLLRNNADGTFADVTSSSGLEGGRGGRDAAFGDLDGDGLLDLVVATDSAGLIRYRNLGAGRFAPQGASEASRTATPARVALLGDVDNDGFLDLVTVTGAEGRLAILRNDRRGDLRTAAVPPRPALSIRAASLVDYDNDGMLDLALAGDPGPGGTGLALLRNEGGGRFSDRSALLPAGLPAGRTLTVFDFSRDLDLDLAMVGPAGLRVLRNDGGNLNHVAQVRLSGLGAGSGKNNAFGIGAMLELRAGDLYQMRVVTGPVTTLGLGRRRKADVLRVVWPNGVPQTLYYPGGDQVLEQQVLNSSCAFLYAWDGTGFRFVTDLMWKSALGMPVGIGGMGTREYAPAAASREYLALTAGALAPDGGAYRLQLTEELWETAYVDQVELIAVDHPDSVGVLVDERFVPPDTDTTLRLIHTRDARPPAAARDGLGRDLLPLLAQRDFRFVSGLVPTRYQGVTEPHELVLDLGPPAGDGRTLLLLSGWVMPTDANLNLAIAQAADLAVQPPELQVRGPGGRWITALADLGFPSGKNKTVVADLTDHLPTGSREVRIRTNMEIYWDQALVARGASDVERRVTRLRPTRADLQYRGFSRMYRRGGRYGPHWFDADQVERRSPWQPIPGMLTRFGDVQPLLTGVEDRYAVMGPGDAVSLAFSARELPPLPPGWRRDFLIYTVGWIKDANHGTGAGGTVGPLPHHAMSRYPYPEAESYLADPARRRFAEAFHTRPAVPDASLRTGVR